MQEIPVYLFLGFLDSGKTKFIQETFEDERFDDRHERTLLLVCEEGEEEYDPSRFAVENFTIEHVSQEDLNAETLGRIQKKFKPERVVVEYNGMLLVQQLFEAMPDGWLIAQVMTFFESPTFLSYNKNMRQLVYDKLQFCDMAVFNRFSDRFSQEEFHKTVRAMTRRPNIVYEYENGQAVYDEIVDPLPFDIDAPIIEIEDRDFAFFYRDLAEETEKYRGKVVRFKGLVAVDKSMKKGTIVIGRHIMTCCEADIQYSGLVCLHASPLPLRTRDWVTVTARIDIAYHSIYGQKGPVLKASALEYAQPPEEEVATFF